MPKGAGPKWRRGDALSAKKLRGQTLRGVGGISTSRGGVSQIGGGGAIGIDPPRTVPYRPVVRMRFKSEDNDYITCRRWDGTTEGTEDVLVAKPWKLRHDADNYGTITSLSTTSASEVDVDDGGGGEDEETWVVTPSYETNDEIYAHAVNGTGVEVGDDELRFIDLNIDARAWAKEDA